MGIGGPFPPQLVATLLLFLLLQNASKNQEGFSRRNEPESPLIYVFKKIIILKPCFPIISGLLLRVDSILSIVSSAPHPVFNVIVPTTQ